VSVLTSSQADRQLVALDVGRDRSTVTAIYAEASPMAQLQLIAAIFESRITVAVLLSDASAYLERPLRQAAASVGLDLLVEHLAPSDDVARSLTRLRGAQVLLAVPDSTLYTPDTLRVLLESTYRRGMPVVGFSSATVVAGTRATAYCAVDDVVADLVEVIEGSAVAGPMPEPRFPQYWRVIVNESVARSLGVPMSDRVRQLGNQPPGRAR
jgi:putative ABC transport system substrate-binding protein